MIKKNSVSLYFIITALGSLSVFGQATELSQTDTIKKWEEIFPLKMPFSNGCEISYKVTREYPPNEAEVRRLEVSGPLTNEKTKAIVVLDSYNKYIERLKNGYKSVREIRMSLSPDTKLVYEITWQDDWDKGVVIRRFFQPDNVIEIDPVQKRVTIKPGDPDGYPEILTQFPSLNKIVGFRPVVPRFLSKGGGVILAVPNPRGDLFYNYEVNAQGLLVNSRILTTKGKDLRRSRFTYTKESGIWPSKISIDVVNPAGGFLYEEIWELTNVALPPKDFVYDPVIAKDFRVLDKTGSNIPQDEINRLLIRQ